MSVACLLSRPRSAITLVVVLLLLLGYSAVAFGLFLFAAEHDIFGEVSSSDDEVNILDSGDEVSGPVGFRPDDVKDSLDLGFAEAAATLDPDVCES